MDSRTVIRTVDFRPGERNVFFHLLSACNLSCRHCYINPEQHGNRSVSREEIDAWLSLFARPQQQANLVWLGGEPTLHPDLPYGIRRARQLGYASVTVDTNGYLFHDFLDHVAPDEVDLLNFSLDGPEPAVNDALRGEGVFATVRDNLARAAGAGFATGVIYTVSRANAAHLHRMPALLSGLGVRRFFIQVIGIRGKTAAGGTEAWQMGAREWLELVPAVAAAAAALGIKTSFPKVFLEPGEDFACAGRVADNYFIFPNGRVYRCPLCEDFPINAFRIEAGRLQKNGGLTEERFFELDIPEGCVMNRLLQPDNIAYDAKGRPLNRISCCLLKQEAVRAAKD